MPRETRAAKTLASQVSALRKRAKATVADDPDGLGVYRAVKFDKPTSKWLHPILEVGRDPRIANLDYDGGALTVTFVPGPQADNTAPFELEDVAAIFDESPESNDADTDGE